MSDTASFAQVGEALKLAGFDCVADRPKILIVATDRWFPTARMGMALAEVGCIVDAIGPSGHPLRLTSAVQRMYPYRGLAPLSSIVTAIRASLPDILVPADDLATWHLHDLCRREQTPAGEFAKLIERSLGSAENFSVIRSRNDFIQLAREEEIRVPQTAVITTTGDLHGWIARNGFPSVLKANGTSGGDGVKVVNTVAEAEWAFHRLQSPPLLARAIKRALVDRDLTLVRPSLFRRRPIVNAQTFIRGREATSAMFCWGGEVLASLHFEVIQKVGTTGHATVVRRIDHSEMSSAAERIARKLKLSGFHGLDFMIEKETGHAFLIEINPRTTQVGHFAFGAGRNLPAAMWAALTGSRSRSETAVIQSDTIALFPQEWKRDPGSAFIATAYHDVPWQEPALVNSCAKQVRTIGAGRLSATIPDPNSNTTAPTEVSRVTQSVGN